MIDNKIYKKKTEQDTKSTSKKAFCLLHYFSYVPAELLMLHAAAKGFSILNQTSD